MTAVVAHEHPQMTIEEYLKLEEHARAKHQYVKGQMIPMPGGTLKHNRIATNILFAIEMAIRHHSLPFLVSNSDTKIWIPKIEAFYYPDAVVICEVPEYYKNRKDVIVNPLLIIEVASPSTQSRDQGRKFLDYATLPSLKEYVIVFQDQYSAQLSSRTDTEDWRLRSVEGIDQLIVLEAIGCSIAMRDVYDRTENL